MRQLYKNSVERALNSISTLCLPGVLVQANQDNFPIDTFFWPRSSIWGLSQCWGTKDGYRPAEKWAAKYEGLADNLKPSLSKQEINCISEREAVRFVYKMICGRNKCRQTCWRRGERRQRWDQCSFRPSGPCGCREPHCISGRNQIFFILSSHYERNTVRQLINFPETVAPLSRWNINMEGGITR